jgi:hypothetical protein
MNFEEAVAIEEEVTKRRKALGAIISVERIRDRLLADILKVCAMFGGGAFLFGLFVMYADGRVNFPEVVTISLFALIGGIVWYIGGSLAVEGLVDSEIRRCVRAGSSCWETLRDIDREKGRRNPSKAAAAARHPVA